MLLFTDQFEDYLRIEQTIAHREVAVVVVAGVLNGEYYQETGVAKKHPTDPQDEKLGLTIAYARAIEQLSKKLTKRANGAIKHLDDIQADKLKKQEQAQKLEEEQQQAKLEEANKLWKTLFTNMPQKGESYAQRPRYYANRQWGQW